MMINHDHRHHRRYLERQHLDELEHERAHRGRRRDDDRARIACAECRSVDRRW